MEQKHRVHVDFPGRILMVGFGSIGTGVLPLILRHIGIPKSRIAILTADLRGKEIARKEGIAFEVAPLTKDNYRRVLGARLNRGDFLLNLSVDVSSLNLIEFCHSRGVLYLDTCIEPWIGSYNNPNLSVSERSNYGLREAVLKFRRKNPKGPTAVLGHGANPGIVSHFLKRALLNIAKDTKLSMPAPTKREEWGALMRALGVKVVHVAEYDSQVASVPKKIQRFENTWSVDGLYAEGVNQPSELGWGTHEKELPKGAMRHTFGCDAAVYLDQPGAKVLVRTWTPEHGSFLGRAITHNESISIADYFTLRNGKEVTYRPTVHYAYRPCDAAILSIEECLGNNSVIQKEQRILDEEIIQGMDELGVLVMGHKKKSYWYGSQLTIAEARALAPYQNATGLQVTAGVLGAMVFAMEHPEEGVLEADEMDFERVMHIIEPYMGKMVGKYTNWTPLIGRSALFPDFMDTEDPWQFKNFRFEIEELQYVS